MVISILWLAFAWSFLHFFYTVLITFSNDFCTFQYVPVPPKGLKRGGGVPPHERQLPWPIKLVRDNDESHPGQWELKYILQKRLRNTADASGSHMFTLIDLKGGTTARNYAVQLNSGNNNGVPQVSNIRMMCIELDTTV